MNAKLRDEIESHRNEHRRFENLYKKLEKELKNLRREMAEIIESSTAAYDQRLYFMIFIVEVVIAVENFDNSILKKKLR